MVLKISDAECRSEDSGALKVDSRGDEHILDRAINECIEGMNVANGTLESIDKGVEVLDQRQKGQLMRFNENATLCRVTIKPTRTAAILREFFAQERRVWRRYNVD